MEPAPQTALSEARMTGREWFRKITHMAAFSPALLLPWLTPGQALLMAAGLFVLNTAILPRILPGLLRPDAPGHGALEVILYPTALLAILAAYGFPALPAGDIPLLPADSAGKPAWYLIPLLAWFALAFVDAAIGIGCRLLPRGPALPWNPRKTLAGVALGLIAAAATLWILAAFLPASFSTLWAAPGAWPVLFAFLLLAALAETAWFGIADNLVMPFAVCVLFPLFPSPFLAAGGIPDVTWPLVALPLGFGFLTYAQGSLTLGAGLLGGAMAFLVMAADPWLFAWLGGFFVLAVAATRFRFQGKEARHVAEARGGRRGASQVFGAMGAAAWMTPLVHLARQAETTGAGAFAAATQAPGVSGAATVQEALLVCAAPFVAKVMDTVSSEMGKAVGGTTLSLRTFRKVAPGSEGGVSLAGTLWGLGAAAALSSLAPILGWGGLREVFWLVSIALAANIFESYWGEWAARRGLDDGPQTNFLMTLFAALLAWVLWIRF